MAPFNLISIHLLFAVFVGTLAIPANKLDEVADLISFIKKTQNVDASEIERNMRENPTGSLMENSGGFEGDIIVDEDMLETLVESILFPSRNAVSKDRRWPGGVVIYEFKKGHFTDAEKQVLKEKWKEIERNTCIRFKKRRHEKTGYVVIRSDELGCRASVGYSADRVTKLNLGEGCFGKSTPMHESLHTLGLEHMHSTYDRDEYVKINHENIRPGKEHNFKLLSQSKVSNLGFPYDFKSIMHYHSRAFSVNELPTIEPVEPGVEINPGQTPSSLDWKRLNKMYKCHQ